MGKEKDAALKFFQNQIADKTWGQNSYPETSSSDNMK
jgi:hypothetical protein